MFVVALHPRSKEATGIQSNTITILTNDSSLTARVFTPYEQAQNHVQVGNYGLALRTMIEWIDLSSWEEDRVRHTKGKK